MGALKRLQSRSSPGGATPKQQGSGGEQLDRLSDQCSEHVLQLARVLTSIENKYKRLTGELVRRDDVQDDRLLKTEEAVQQLKAEFEHLKEIEALRRHEVCRLEALVEAERLQFSLTENRLQQMLVDEQLRSERMRLVSEDALSQKEDAMAELASAYADMEAMQATLADSAIYVRYLRRKVLELEVENSRHAARTTLSSSSGGSDASSAAGAFNMSSIKSAITAAVEEAYRCDAEERKKRLKQLQLRWHPDKNPVLTEVATEVTKLINEAVAAAERRKTGGSASGSSTAATSAGGAA